jgi:hypothetical protein
MLVEEASTLGSIVYKEDNREASDLYITRVFRNYKEA